MLEGIGVEGGLVAGRPGIQVDRLTLRVSWLRAGAGGAEAVRDIEAENVYVAVARDEEGRWQPAAPASVVRRVAGWIGCELPADAPAESAGTLAMLFARSLSVRRARAVWYGERDVILQLTGMDWRNDILRAGRHEFMYRALLVEQADFRSGPRMKNVRIEFLQTPRRTLVLHASAGADRKTTDAVIPEPTRGGDSMPAAWEPPDEARALRQAWSEPPRP